MRAWSCGLVGLTALGACGSSALPAAEVVADSADEDIGLIVKPDTEAPHCLDVESDTDPVDVVPLDVVVADTEGDTTPADSGPADVGPEDSQDPDTETQDTAGAVDTVEPDSSPTDAAQEDVAPDDTAVADGDVEDTAAEDTVVADTLGPGTCEGAPDGASCDDGDPCTAPDRCLDGLCVGGAQDPCVCPEGMVVADGFCIDQYEASRPDATPWSMGGDTSRATSREGVIPWFPIERAAALVACEAAGKRLCTVDEIGTACAGPEGRTYPYGDTYVAEACNGIDAFCYCDSGPCATAPTCPYPRCYDRAPDGSAGGCGAAFGVRPTGSFPGCVNAYGAYDLSGNVWELVDLGTATSWYRGGAFNCLDSESLHRCGGLYQGISARGFRCCASIE